MKRLPWPYILLGVAIAVILVFLLACAGGDDPPVIRNPDPRTSATAGSSPPASPAAGTITDGTWAVGTEITAGTYKTTVPAGSLNCYWARLKAADGEPASVIANKNHASGPVAVTIAATDKWFESKGCGTWTRTG